MRQWRKNVRIIYPRCILVSILVLVGRSLSLKFLLLPIYLPIFIITCFLNRLRSSLFRVIHRVVDAFALFYYQMCTNNLSSIPVILHAACGHSYYSQNLLFILDLICFAEYHERKYFMVRRTFFDC